MRQVPRRSAALLALGLLALLPAARAGEEAPADLVPRRWLALDAVDQRGRHPFNPNTPFRLHLLDREAPPPRAGEVVEGSRGRAPWRAVEADGEGRVADPSGTWFFAEVDAPSGGVHLAHLDRASALFVNGAGFVGDLYGLGLGPVPVALRKGTNRLFVAGPRGPWSLRLEPWTADRSPLLPGDATLPDAVEGEYPDAEAAFRVLNPEDRWVPGSEAPWLEAEGFFTADPPSPDPRPALAPLWTGKVPLVLAQGHAPQRARGEAIPFAVRAVRAAGTEVVSAGPPVPFRMEVRKPGAARRVTFTSRVDGSVQYYAVLPPAPGEVPAAEMATLLTLHGAGVEALGQARAYAARPDFRVVAPTNRRPFGFDWEDWGRTDAYEVLADAMGSLGGDPDRVFLTGHSMGGHGAWHLAANDPDRWAAVAPSAGWRSFDTYAGGRPETPLAPLWRAADAGSRTEDLLANLVPLPTFILHGTKDDNVPLSEAEAMLAALRDAGGAPMHHFQEGAGHWWDGDAAAGADCVDWPGIFDLFRRTRLPLSRAAPTGLPHGGPLPVGPATLDWTSADLSLDASHFWVSALQPLAYGKPLRIRARRTGSGVEATTENVRRLHIDSPDGAPLGRLAVDGREVPLAAGSRCAALLAEGESWRLVAEHPGHAEPAVPAGERGPSAGPFKRAFGNRFVLVVGTRGTEEENREMLELARHLSGQWWYRANGLAPVVRDADLLALPGEFAGRNLVLLGNADVNGAWEGVVPASCPVAVRRGEVRVGAKAWKGEGLGALFLHPRADPRGGMVAALASTGARGTRVGYGLLPFVSGVGYPDWAVFGEEFLAAGDGGVRAAGWFDHRWGLQPGGFAREEGEGR